MHLCRSMYSDILNNELKIPLTGFSSITRRKKIYFGKEKGTMVLVHIVPEYSDYQETLQSTMGI